jgi:hypothetical protein
LHIGLDGKNIGSSSHPKYGWMHYKRMWFFSHMVMANITFGWLRFRVCEICAIT